MSDSVNTDEIDDVMSSVRKLVSHGEKVPLGSRSHAEPQKDLERFVLTESLRVAEPQPEVESVAKQPYNVLLLDPAKRADRAGLEATIAELEAAVTAQPDDWEPDEGEVFDDAAWAASAFQLHAIADAVEFEIGATDDLETQDLSAPEADKDVPGIPAEIDVEALRAIVVEVLREELNGEMGERITRNVRKLVRREINRVLVSRDLD